MILQSTGSKLKIKLDSPKFQVAFSFLARPDLEYLDEGRYELGENVYASVQHYISSAAEGLAFESHQRYHDIQYVVRGYERIGYISIGELTPKSPYDEQNDVTFYQEPTLSGSVLIREGDFVVLSPEDGHKPRCIADCACPIIKVVVKVPV